MLPKPQPVEVEPADAPPARGSTSSTSARSPICASSGAARAPTRSATSTTVCVPAVPSRASRRRQTAPHARVVLVVANHAPAPRRPSSGGERARAVRAALAGERLRVLEQRHGAARARTGALPSAANLAAEGCIHRTSPPSRRRAAGRRRRAPDAAARRAGRRRRRNRRAPCAGRAMTRWRRRAARGGATRRPGSGRASCSAARAAQGCASARRTTSCPSAAARG